MRVYIITDGIYSDYHICAVCVDKEKAEFLADKFDGEVEEYETKDVDIYFSGKNEYRIMLDTKTGVLEKCEKKGIVYTTQEHATNTEKSKKEIDRGYFYFCRNFKKSVFKITVQAVNKEKAIKIARDILAKRKAEINLL